MTIQIEWDVAEKMGLVLPLSDSECVDISSGQLNVSGASHQLEIPQSPFQKLLEKPIVDATSDITSAANELLQTYGEKAAMIASDRATFASYARSKARRDYWVGVFTEIRRISVKQLPVTEKENIYVFSPGI